MQELTEPLLAITQSDAEPVVTTDDNSVRTPADSPVLAPINPKGAVAARLRKAKGKGKRTEILSRCASLKLSLTNGSGDEGRKPNAKAKGKRGRRWGEDGAYDADGGNEILDFSSATESLGPAPSRNIETLVSTTSSAKFELDDDEDDDDNVDDSTPAKGGWAIFRNIVGGKVLTDDDLKEPLEQMHQFLLAKNVAGEVSVHLCDSVKQSLTGQKTGSFQSNPHISILSNR
jgi:signal recognition particle receptor subunit alpha